MHGGGDDAAGIPRYARAGGAASRRRFSCGVHPLNRDEEYDVEELRKLAAENGVVAMGETGLDYFYTPETKARQQASFRDHIRIGRELNKPVIVHTRDARADTLEILREEK